jgi:hypothetical protein
MSALPPIATAKADITPVSSLRTMDKPKAQAKKGRLIFEKAAV